MFKSVIFDFDGVIIDSHDVQIKSLTKSFKDVVGAGKPPIDDFFKHSGNSLENIFIKLGLPLEMVSIYRNVSNENMNLIKIHTGMRELLDELKEKNIICSLCTGKERKRTIEILKYFNLEKYFRVIVCSDDVKNPKPAPESLIKIKKTLKCNKHDMVIVGDGINDILVAKNFGIHSIAVSWGDLSVGILNSYKPSFLVRTADELKKVILCS